MGEAYITRRGAAAFAAIGVTFPSGSTCSCKNSSSVSIVAASSSATYALFLVGAAGSYTVSATNGTDTVSKSVTISTQGQGVSVELAYSFVLFANGVLDSKYTLAVGSISNGVLNGATSGSKSIAIKPAVNVTDYSTLTVEFGTMSGDGYVTFGLRDSYSDGYDGYEGSGYAVCIGGTAYGSGPSNFSNKTYTLDLSQITGEKYVKLSLNLSGTQTCQIKSIIFK